MSDFDTMITLSVLQRHVGGCREDLGPDQGKCWRPSEFVLWGKLIPPEGLGPRCYEHAEHHVGPDALRPGTQYALIRLADLASELADDAPWTP